MLFRSLHPILTAALDLNPIRGGPVGGGVESEMATVVGTVAGSVAGKIVPKLLDFLLEKHKLRAELENEIKYIRSESAMICAAIREDGAHPPWSGDEVHKAWIQMVRELAYAIDDCIDRFMHRVAPVAGASWLRRRAHRVETVKARNEFASEIRRLRKASEDASVLRTKYTTGVYGRGRGAWESGSGPGAPETETDTTVSAAGLPVPAVGLDAARDELMELIGETTHAQQPKELKVISIVGFGGIGKTLLARYAYTSPAVVSQYQARAWVRAANKAEMDVLNDILRQLGVDPATITSSDASEGSSCSSDPSTAELCAAISTHLQTERFFIVIDDMRAEFWENIKDAFPVVPRADNRVIITTANRIIAKKCSSPAGHVYVMRTLADKPSRELFFEKACLVCQTPTGDTELGSEVLKKCDGLPLALVSAARLLHGDPTREEWAHLSQNLGRDLGTNGNLASMNRVLVRSYTSLSKQDIKICLLYLGIYPSGRPIRRGSLLRRWLAERLITEDPTRSAVEVAVANFNELVNQSIIQPITDASSSNNAKSKTCQTHGMMLEFILHNTENFVTLLYDKAPLPSYIRWLSLHNKTAERSKINPSDLPLLRSLTVFGKVHNCMLDFSKYKLMRVLDLEECGNQLEDKHLKVICNNLLLLRYLSLRGAATVTVIPEEVKKLKLLETLDIRRTNIEILPPQVMELPCLIHLFGKFKLKQDVDRRIGKLQVWLKKNSKLQKVAGFVVDDKNQGFTQLMEHMDQLMKVKIWCEKSTSNSTDPIATTNSNLSHLSNAIKGFITRSTQVKEAHSLSLNFNDEWFQGLLVDLSLEKEAPPCYLSSLKLQGDNICSLPPFVTMLRGLTKLCLSSPNHQLSGEILAALSRVCGLECLKIIAARLVNLIIRPGALGSLRCLCVVVEAMMELKIEEKALPRLDSLQLLCKDLSDFRHATTIWSLPRLNEVALHDGLSNETKKEWEKAAKNHPRRPKLSFVLNTKLVRSEPAAETPVAPATSTTLSVAHDAISNGHHQCPAVQVVTTS